LQYKILTLKMQGLNLYYNIETLVGSDPCGRPCPIIYIGIYLARVPTRGTPYGVKLLSSNL